MDTNKFIVILSTQRSGSTMICKDLSSTSCLGKPREYFLPWLKEKDFELTNDCLTRLNNILSKSRTENGVGALKIMSNQIDRVGALLTLIPGITASDNIGAFYQVFQNSFYIRVFRSDKIRQAISRIIARETKVYHRNPAQTAKTLSVKEKPENLKFDYLRISREISKIEREEKIWDRFIEENSIKIFNIEYENVIDDLSYLRAISSELGIELHNLPVKRATVRLSNQINDEWYDKFIRFQ